MAGGVELLCYHESSRFAQSGHCINLNKWFNNWFVKYPCNNVQEYLKLYTFEMKAASPESHAILSVKRIHRSKNWTIISEIKSTSFAALYCNATCCNSPYWAALHLDPSHQFYQNLLSSFTALHCNASSWSPSHCKAPHRKKILGFLSLLFRSTPLYSTQHELSTLTIPTAPYNRAILCDWLIPFHFSLWTQQLIPLYSHLPNSLRCNLTHCSRFNSTLTV